MARYGQGSMWEPEQPGPQAQAPQQQAPPPPTGPGTQTLNEMGGAPYGAQPVGPGPQVPDWGGGGPAKTPPMMPPNLQQSDPRWNANLQDYNPTGNAAVDAIRNEIRTQFQLGGHDLSDPATQSAAMNAFDRLIQASGGQGVGALQSEIGQVRTLDRLRELIGKGDTLDQSGNIGIGGGLTIQSLRDLAEFNNPAMAENPMMAQQPAQYGYNKLGNARRVPGRTNFGGGQPQSAGGPSYAGPAPPGGGGGGGEGGMGWAGGALKNIYQTGGVDPALLAQQQQSLRENMSRQFGASLPILQEAMSQRGIGGAGLEGIESANLMENLQGQAGTNLRDLATQMGLQGQMNQLGAAQTAGQLGTTQRGQTLQNQLGWGNIGLGDRQLGVQRELGLGGLSNEANQIANQLALGQGNLALGNQGLNLDAANVFGNQQLQWAQLASALQQGGNQGLTDLLNQYLGGLGTSAGGGIG